MFVSNPDFENTVWPTISQESNTLNCALVSVQLDGLTSTASSLVDQGVD